MESLYHDFKIEAEQKNIKLKINITLSEIDNLIRTDEEKYPLYYHICFLNVIY
jgi:hypothetical protein